MKQRWFLLALFAAGLLGGMVGGARAQTAAERCEVESRQNKSESCDEAIKQNPAVSTMAK